MNANWLARVAVVGWCWMGVAVAQATGSIAGMVTDMGGKPVGSVLVTYQRKAVSAEDARVAVGKMFSLDGGFRFQGLAAATYYLCVQSAPSRGYLDSCEWTFQAPSVALAPGQAVANVRLALEKGARLEVRVKDPKKIVPNKSDASGFFETGVYGGNGVYHSAPLLSKDNEGSDFVLVVPYEKDLTVTWSGSDHRVVDEQGKDVDKADAKLKVKAARTDAKMRVELIVDKAAKK